MIKAMYNPQKSAITRDILGYGFFRSKKVILSW